MLKSSKLPSQFCSLGKVSLFMNILNCPISFMLSVEFNCSIFWRNRCDWMQHHTFGEKFYRQTPRIFNALLKLSPICKITKKKVSFDESCSTSSVLDFSGRIWRLFTKPLIKNTNAAWEADSYKIVESFWIILLNFPIEKLICKLQLHLNAFWKYKKLIRN